MRQGYIREKLDVKLLILYILDKAGAADADALLDMTLLEEGFGYFEYSEALAELKEGGFIEVDGEGMHTVSESGRLVLSPYVSRLPPSVRRDAQASVYRVLTRLRNEGAIVCETIIRSPADMTERLILRDGDEEIMRLEMMVAGHSQVRALEQNFRRHPDKIYNRILEALLHDYSDDTANSEV